MAVDLKLDTRVITGKIRMSYVNLFVPRAVTDGEELRYSLCLIIPKDDEFTLRQIKRAVEGAGKAGLGLWGGRMPEDLKLPLRDGDAERGDMEEYKNSWFLNASSKYKPGVVDKELREIVKESEVYSGCYGRVSIGFYPFNNSGHKGIGCSLFNVQKLSEGEPLAVRRRPVEDFGSFDYEEDFLG